MLETHPFDPADYLDTEESVAAYLEDARIDGPEALAAALQVAARARARMRGEPLQGVAEPRPRDFKPG